MNESLENYKSLIKAVIENAMSDYVKLQHPANRRKKYLQESLIVASAMFFDSSFRFTIFVNNDGSKMSIQDALFFSMNFPTNSYNKFINNLLNDMELYWYDKHFQNIKIPNEVSICGRLYFINLIENLNNTICDKEKLLISLDKNNRAKDREFINSCLKIIVDTNEIKISKDDFKKLSKALYLFIKINGGFTTENDTTT